MDKKEKGRYRGRKEGLRIEGRKIVGDEEANK